LSPIAYENNRLDQNRRNTAILCHPITFGGAGIEKQGLGWENCHATEAIWQRSASVCHVWIKGNGNLMSKTDNRGIATSYQYDALNRLTQKSYGDGTASVAYSYDTDMSAAPAARIIRSGG
jgi:YD repeat-containing protein